MNDNDECQPEGDSEHELRVLELRYQRASKVMWIGLILACPLLPFGYEVLNAIGGGYPGGAFMMLFVVLFARVWPISAIAFIAALCALKYRQIVEETISIKRRRIPSALSGSTTNEHESE